MPNRRRASSGWVTGSSPSRAIVPLVGRSRVVSIWIVVVLPAPLGPRKAKISPARTSNEMPSTALTSPKVLTRFWTWIMPYSSEGRHLGHNLEEVAVGVHEIEAPTSEKVIGPHVGRLARVIAVTDASRLQTAED